MAAAPSFLRGGFRPFFFGGAAWGLIALTLWLLALDGLIVLPTHLEPLSWHRHEMLFGFVGAVIAGFLLTAIPNWTGRLPIAGKPLAALAGLWLVARIAVLFSAITGAWTAAVLDVGFFMVLVFVGAREVLKTKNRNLAIVGVLLLFGIADALDHAAANGVIRDNGIGIRAGIALVVLMISLIGGRITPSFTRNWMIKQGIVDRLPTQPGQFDILVIASTALAMLGWVLVPGDSKVGAMILIAALMQLLRLARWGGLRARRDPLVLILHVGYAWIPVGLLLLGLKTTGLAVPQSAAIHALTAGAMATMILAVMTRASLGHTGRELKANGATIAIYILITAGALVRLGTAFQPAYNTASMVLAGSAWGAALLLFLIAYAPVLWEPPT
ncbi:MAG: NnrS family protein [Sphingomonas bacterium]|nr:NnrS family protein [Sphingomonas bacterium]